MPLKEKINQQDLILYEIVRNPVLFTEFIHNIDKPLREDAFELSYYQKEILLNFNNYVSIEAGRAVGKTVSLVNYIIWALVYNVFSNDYIVYAVPSKVHLDPVWSGLIRLFRSNSFLKHFIPNNAGINSSEFSIRLSNQSQLICRIAGQTGTGANVIGLHTPVFMVDESGYFPWQTWVELQPAVNSFTTGFKLMVSGVPDGRRENSVNYHCDRENSSYSKHRITAFKNPRFSEEDKKRALELYGGEDTEDYIHLVLGEHGKPVFALFDRSTMEIVPYPVYKLSMNGIEMSEDIAQYYNKLALFPALPDRKTKCILGIDLGYTEPTAIVILYLDSYGRLKFHGRIQLTKISYPIQERLIDVLDTKFEPFIIGIDKGGVGMPTVQRLQESLDYVHKNYEKRLIPIDFSSQIILGNDINGEELKSKAKPLSVSILQDYSNNHKIIYSSTDLEMVSELERMTYTKTVTGDIVYRTVTPLGGKKGDDHFTSALLCASLAYYLNNEFTLNNARKRKLVQPSWLMS